MATRFTSNKIFIPDTVFQGGDRAFTLHGRQYRLRDTIFSGYPYQKVVTVYNSEDINLYGNGVIGYDGRGFAGSTTHFDLDDSTPILDYYIGGPSPNNSITIYSFLSAYNYNNNTSSIDTTRITGGIYRGSARWNSSGTITVAGLQRVGGYSGSNWSSPGTSDNVGNAFAFIAIGNDLYLRARKAPVSGNFTTYSSISWFGASTFEQYAFNGGYDAGVTNSGCGQGFF